MNTYPTQERLKELFCYDEKSGEIFWRSPTSNRVSVGDPAGHVYEKNGARYNVIKIDGRYCKAATAAWIYTYGYPPKNFLDHINGIGTDNRIENLRESNPVHNQKNLKKYSNNTSGHVGVYRKRNKWMASITESNKTHSLGNFDTIEEAILVRIYAQHNLGFSQRHGT